jgi:hemoglobin-like flavoprotein
MSLQVEILEQSFERVKPQANDFSFSFYQNLFNDYPQLRPLFAKTNMEQQQQKLMMSLVLVVENLHNPSYLKVILKNLGERHVSYRTLKEHYPMVGAALLKTLESYLGKDWTPEVKQAWTHAYGVLVELMLEGAKYPENTIQQKDKPVESSKASTPAPANATSVNYSQGTSKFENVSTSNSVKPVESSKAPTPAPANATSVNYSQGTSKFENVSTPDTVEPVESSKVSSQTTANTPIINLKLLLIVSVIAGLLGLGLFYFHSNSKQNNSGLKNNSGLTTSAAKTI